MIDHLIRFVQKYVDLNKEEADFIRNNIPVQTFPKGTILLEQGKISGASYFNLKGCVRMFYKRGLDEKTAFFYTENQFISSIESFTRRVPAKHSFQCLEDTTLAIIPYELENELMQRFSKIESFARLILEEELSIYQEIVASFITSGPEERYQNLMKNHPELLNRIPQYYLASYLGVKAESLSRIRKRISSH